MDTEKILEQLTLSGKQNKRLLKKLDESDYVFITYETKQVEPDTLEMIYTLDEKTFKIQYNNSSAFACFMATRDIDTSSTTSYLEDDKCEIKVFVLEYLKYFVEAKPQTM